MSHKKLILIAIPLFAILSAIIYGMRTFNSVGVFIFDFSIAFLVVSVFLLFVRQSVFYAWSKMAMFFLPVATVFSLLAPEISSDPFFPVEKKIVILFFSFIFILTSLILIIFKSLQLRKGQE